MPNKTTQTGAYLAGKFSLAEPLKLITGIRLSDWKYESDDGVGNRKFKNEVTPYAGLVLIFLISILGMRVIPVFLNQKINEI